MALFFHTPLCDFENRAIRNGYSRIAGTDEAGRGALEGPVVAACIMLDPSNIPSGIDDSKKLSAAKREELYGKLEKSALSIGIGTIPPSIIDEVNIYGATKLAMKSALASMDIRPDFLLIDSVKLLDITISSLPIVKGDQKSVSIAAASIIAKVYRDRIMNGYSAEYPAFGFSSHKGYGTRMHRDALERYGPTPIHRMTFNPVKSMRGPWRLREQP